MSLEALLATLAGEIGEAAQALLELRADQAAGRPTTAGLQELVLELEHAAAAASRMLDAARAELTAAPDVDDPPTATAQPLSA